jgi:hypothetical protein
MTKELEKSQVKTQVSLKLQSFKDMIELATNIAEYIKTTPFADNFAKDIPVLDKDGNFIEDSLGNKKTEKKVDNNDIIACILLGEELGIPPMKAIMLGGSLNKDAILKVEIGKTLGLSAIRSLDSISVISTRAGTIPHLGVNIITKVLNEAGVKIKILEDFKAVYQYQDVYENTVLSEDEFNELEKIHIVKKSDTKEKIAELFSNGYSILVKQEITKRTKVRLERKEQEPVEISYTLKEATEAGLYKGKDSSGKTVDGKDNWNKHPSTMLRNRAITIAGRIIAADKLNKIYSTEEALEIHKESEEDLKRYSETIIEDAEIISEDINQTNEDVD